MNAPLPAWNDGIAKQAILDFVAQVTTEHSPTFVAPADRIAVFDNDGTLWCEYPMYAPHPQPLSQRARGAGKLFKVPLPTLREAQALRERDLG